MPVADEHYTAELRALLTNLGLKHHEVEHILHNNDDHKQLLYELLTCGESFDGVPDDELPSFVAEFLGLNADSHLTATTLLASYVASVRAAIVAGKLNKNKGVRHFGNLVLDTASGQFYLNGHQRRLIQTLIFQFGVTVDKLRAANATPMGVFTPPIRALIKRTMPSVPALLGHVLAQLDSERAAAQIPASRKRVRVQGPDEAPEVIQEPAHAQLLCDESIADLGPECSTDRPDGKTVSPDHEEASGHTTPPPTKMSKREIIRLNCAPRKMQRP